MWGHHKIPILYKIWGAISHIVHVGDHMIPIPFKVWATIRVI